MKNSIHLVYGIIIGVLGFACLGSGLAKPKQFKNMYTVEYGSFNFEDSDGKTYYVYGWYNKGAEYKKRVRGEHLIMEADTADVSTLLKNGWTILDVEVDKGDVYYFIGK